MAEQVHFHQVIINKQKRWMTTGKQNLVKTRPQAKARLLDTIFSTLVQIPVVLRTRRLNIQFTQNKWFSSTRDAIEAKQQQAWPGCWLLGWLTGCSCKTTPRHRHYHHLLLQPSALMLHPDAAPELMAYTSLIHSQVCDPILLLRSSSSHLQHAYAVCTVI